MHDTNRKKGNVLFNNAFNTFYLQLYGVRHMVKDHSVREETCCFHFMHYSFQLSARDVLYALPHRPDSKSHVLKFRNVKYQNGCH